VIAYQSPEEPLGSSPISSVLQEYIYYLPILVNGAPEIVLFASDLHKDFIYVEGVTISLVSSFHATGVHSTELDAPEAD
jgi:hypothetical protein